MEELIRRKINQYRIQEKLAVPFFKIEDFR